MAQTANKRQKLEELRATSERLQAVERDGEGTSNKMRARQIGAELGDKLRPPIGRMPARNENSEWTTALAGQMARRAMELSEEDCGICHEPIPQKMFGGSFLEKLPCGHMFHARCIFGLLAAKGQARRLSGAEIEALSVHPDEDSRRQFGDIYERRRVGRCPFCNKGFVLGVGGMFFQAHEY
jgi:hypothetical protein